MAQNRDLITHVGLLPRKVEISSQTHQEDQTFEEPKNTLGNSKHFGLKTK